MKFDDFTWNDIIFEAPGDADDGMDELSASDYADAEGMDIESEDPAGEDPTAEEGEGDPADEDPLGEDGEEDPADEDPLAEDGEGDPADEDPLAEDGEGDSANEEEQTDNAENDVNADIQNKHLANDFIELYHRIDEIMNQIRTDCKTNIRYNPNIQVVRRNLVKLKETTYEYLVNKFAKETYVSNLYQFNLIIQALNVNIDLLSSVLASNKKFNEKKEKNKKKPNNKKDK